MASLIVFGVIAVIVIVFLLSFNIKTVSKPGKKGLELDKPRELPVNMATNPQLELPENQKLREKEDTEGAKEISNRLPRMSDNQYRQALRHIELKQEKKPTEISQNRLNDLAYRNAARSIYKKSK
jgi:hypothetical protein